MFIVVALKTADKTFWMAGRETKSGREWENRFDSKHSNSLKNIKFIFLCTVGGQGRREKI